jgi:hypothetical protein
MRWHPAGKASCSTGPEVTQPLHQALYLVWHNLPASSSTVDVVRKVRAKVNLRLMRETKRSNLCAVLKASGTKA